MHSMPPCLRQICGGLILVCGLIRQHSIRIDALYTYRHIGIRHIFYFYRRVGLDIYFIFMRWIIYIYIWAIRYHFASLDISVESLSSLSRYAHCRYRCIFIDSRVG